MKTFTRVEKTIARNIDWEYRWMARDSNGALCVYKKKPKKAEAGYLGGGGFNHLAIFDHLFLAIKWEDDEPTLIRDIYNPPILNDLEREYLKTVLKPFHEVVEYVKKIKNGDKEYLFIPFSGNRALSFPDFDSGKMYAGMELNRKYKLDELGITYEEEDE